MTPKFEYINRGTSVRYVEPRSEFQASELDMFLAEHQCDDVTINQVYGRGQADFDEVLRSKRTRCLSLVLDSACFSQLASNRTVERLYFSGHLKERFDFSQAKNLRSLTIQWHDAVEGLDLMPWLEELNLRKFKGDRAFLENLNFLIALGLIETDILSVEFLKSFGSLRKLDLSYARRLVNLEGLLFLKDNLLELELDHLPNIHEYDGILSGLKKLKKLKVMKCPPLPDLQFVRSLPALEFFSFVDTNVLSGDITPCMGLKYVGFLDKKSYNCTWNRLESRLVPKSVRKAKLK